MPDPALEDQSPTEYDACTARNHAFHDGWNARQRRRPSQGQGWSFEENLAANWGMLPPGRWADVQGAEQSPAGPGREVQASLQAAGQQSGELRRRVDELERENKWLLNLVDTADDAARSACEALEEVRASEADLRQRLAQMEADAALGAEPGGREEHVVP